MAVLLPPEQTINYYEDLESYSDEIAKAEWFTIHVNLNTGKSGFMSSPMPMNTLSRLISVIDTSDSSKTALTLWSRESRNLVIIPHEQIQTVTISLLS